MSLLKKIFYSFFGDEYHPTTKIPRWVRKRVAKHVPSDYKTLYYKGKKYRYKIIIDHDTCYGYKRRRSGK